MSTERFHLECTADDLGFAAPCSGAEPFLSAVLCWTPSCPSELSTTDFYNLSNEKEMVKLILFVFLRMFLGVEAVLQQSEKEGVTL